MTQFDTAEEAAFQLQLDADPYDQNTRAAFADWLEDRGDPRAKAVRELWRMGWTPYVNNASEWTTGDHNVDESEHGIADRSELPKEWWEEVAKQFPGSGGIEGSCYCRLEPGFQWACWPTRLACESAVIAAYVNLKPDEVPA